MNAWWLLLGAIIIFTSISVFVDRPSIAAFIAKRIWKWSAGGFLLLAIYGLTKALVFHAELTQLIRICR